MTDADEEVVNWERSGGHLSTERDKSEGHEKNQLKGGGSQWCSQRQNLKIKAKAETSTLKAKARTFEAKAKANFSIRP